MEIRLECYVSPGLEFDSLENQKLQHKYCACESKMESEREN